MASYQRPGVPVPRTNILQQQGTGRLPRQPTRGVQPAYPPTRLPGYRQPNLTPQLLQQMAARRLGR